MIRFLFISMLLATCSTPKNLQRIDKIILESRTRGFQKTLTLDAQSITSYINIRGTESTTVTAIDASSWEGMCACLTALPLTSLPELSSDLSDIAVDRSAMTSIIVQLSNEEVFESGTIDLSQPPAALDCFFKIYSTISPKEE